MALAEFTKEVRDWLQDVLKQIDPKAKVSLKFPWEALKLLQKFELDKESIQGQIETGVKWDVPIIVGKGSVVKFPTRIEGPVIIGENTVIGPFAFLRGPVVIGSDCNIGSAEIKNSIVMDGSFAKHFNFIGDSIIGRKCNLGAGTKLADLRFDGEIVKVTVEDKKYSSGMQKLGAILEDGVQTGCNSVLNPGTYVVKKGKVMPCSAVSGFVK